MPASAGFYYPEENMTEELSDEALMDAILGVAPMTNNQASALLKHMSGSNMIAHFEKNKGTIPNVVLESYFAENFTPDEVKTIIDMSPKWVDGTVQVSDINQSVIDSVKDLDDAIASGNIEAIEKAVDSFNELIASNTND